MQIFLSPASISV